MTIKNLIDAIAEALFVEFGDGYEIYTEQVEQGLQEPCFLIRCVNPTRNRHLGERYLRTNLFSIQYIPSTEGAYDECISVLERLFECLKSVNLHGKPIHGKEIGGEITDGFLTFTVNYDGFVIAVDEETNMGDLDILTESKG